MSRSAYARMTCPVCGVQIACAGLSKTNHFRKHVREGRMKETRPRRWPYENLIFDVIKEPK